MTRLRHWRLLGLVLVPFLFLGCATAKAWWTGSPDTVTRFLADIGCITALSTAAIQVAGDPMVNGAKTPLGVAAAIAAVGSSNIPATVLAACKDTIALASQDAAAVTTIAQNTEGTTAPKAVMPRLTSPPPQPKTPQPVVIPVPKRPS